MKELVFLLEEQSAEELLKIVVPKLVPAELLTRFVTFEGKQDLERQLIKRLKGYRNPEARFVVLRDQDSNPDCKAVKRKLQKLCRSAGKPSALIRIACKELESFYLADLAAVERGLELKGLAAQQQRAKFRSPDKLPLPSHELSFLTRGAYQKVSGSRAIAPHLNVENQRSGSFRNLVSGIRRMATSLSRPNR